MFSCQNFYGDNEILISNISIASRREILYSSFEFVELWTWILSCLFWNESVLLCSCLFKTLLNLTRTRLWRSFWCFWSMIGRRLDKRCRCNCLMMFKEQKKSMKDRRGTLTATSLMYKILWLDVIRKLFCKLDLWKREQRNISVVHSWFMLSFDSQSKIT